MPNSEMTRSHTNTKRSRITPMVASMLSEDSKLSVRQITDKLNQEPGISVKKSLVGSVKLELSRAATPPPVQPIVVSDAECSDVSMAKSPTPPPQVMAPLPATGLNPAMDSNPAVTPPPIQPMVVSDAECSDTSMVKSPTPPPQVAPPRLSRNHNKSTHNRTKHAKAARVSKTKVAPKPLRARIPRACKTKGWLRQRNRELAGDSSSSDESSSDSGSKGRSKGRCGKGKFTKGHTPWNKKV